MISDVRVTSGPDPVTGRDRTPLNRALNLFGLAVVAFSFVTLADGRPPVVLVLGGTAIALWLVASLVPARAVRLGCLVLMLVLGAVTMESTEALLIAPVIAAVIAFEGDERLNAWIGVTAACVAAAIDLVTAAVTAAPVGFLLGTLGGIALALIVGYSRRQARVAARQRDELVAERLAAEREQERAALLADRTRAARDVHDVLAHSLGGLVLQLDAVEALLEAGRTDEAAHRASDARTLAADGLAEARRAVAALRDTGEDSGPAGEMGRTRPGGAAPADRSTTPPQPTGSVDRGRGRDRDGARTDPSGLREPSGMSDPSGLPELIAAHRSFGGEIAVVGDPMLPEVDDLHRRTVVLASREALSNARKHAPGAPVTLTVEPPRPEIGVDTVRVTVANPVVSGGHGLIGVRERFAELDDGSSVEVGSSVQGSGSGTAVTFAVSMRVPAAGGRA